MANVIKIKSRQMGVAGAPSKLARAELAYDELGQIIYIGHGDGVDSTRSKKAIGGIGAFIDLASPQTLTNKTFPEPTSDSSPATKSYVDNKYSQERYDEDITTSEWVFNTNQHEWAVTHNLGYYPDVTTMALISDDNYEEFDAYVQHNSVNDLTVICTGTTTGKLLLR